MVTQNELKAFYEIDLKPKLLFFEEQRQLLVSKLKPIGIIYGILVIFAILMMIIISNLDEARRVTIIGVDNEEMIAVAFFAPTIYLITVTIVIIISYKKMKSSYQAHFKKAVVGSLVTLIDENLSYAPEKTISVEAFHTSQLFKQEYGNRVENWSGEDYVSGILDGKNVKFSEVHAQEVETEIDDEGNVDTYTVTIFKGLFFIFNVNWDFEGTTFILPNNKLSFKKILQLLKLTKPALEREFVVYSDNPIIANYVFSTAFMQRLLALRRRLKTPIHLSFVNGKLYMAIPVTEDLFEPPVYETVLNFQFIQTTFEYMRLGKVIVEELITLMKQPNSMDFE
ncbi:MAG: hypothetical protein DRR19_24295 [Candidatus Parabeggiatoa sp. nov. 1]|nr:MAG: hypothetical protein DRR19_24295 [Gammaproteobacteria bacterium]